MSQEAVPEHAAHGDSAPAREGAPKGLLQQMEDLMATLNADLSRLDADLSQPATHRPADRSPTDHPAGRDDHADGVPGAWGTGRTGGS